MGDQGLKLTQPGKDIGRAGDAELLFSSAWPTAKIVFNGRFDTFASDKTQLLQHKLGYVPAFMHYTIDHSGNRHDDEIQSFREIITADKDWIYWNPAGGSGNSVALKMGLVVFDINIEQNFTAPQIKFGTSSGLVNSKDFGLKFSKEDKDITSDDLRDYMIHSAARGPMVHQVVNVLPNDKGSFGTTKNHTHTHDLPYSPMFLAYVQTSGNGDEYNLINNFAGLTTSGKNITFTGITSGKRAALVILKDPFEIDDNVQTINS